MRERRRQKKPPRILLIEDNLVNRELLLALLEGDGYAVLTAERADAGMALARAERPALILMDIQLPGMTGYEATRQLKAEPSTRAIPVVAVTAQAMRGDEARARAAGCDAFVSKPVDFAAMRTILRRFLGPAPGDLEA